MASASERSDYDLIVVGSGAGGATVARQMAVNGHRVLVLERGGRASMLGAAPTVALALEKMGLPNVWTIVALAHRLAGHLHRRLAGRPGWAYRGSAGRYAKKSWPWTFDKGISESVFNQLGTANRQSSFAFSGRQGWPES